jgi:hypothetical protein
VLASVEVFRGLQSGNAIVVGTRSKAAPSCDTIKERAKQTDKAHGFSFDLQMSARRCRPIEQTKLDDVPVLRDAREDEFKALSARP